jgi:hypothetical protein
MCSLAISAYVDVVNVDSIQTVMDTMTKKEPSVIVAESDDSIILTFQINNSQQAMSNMLDKMIAEQSKFMARKQKLEEDKKKSK